MRILVGDVRERMAEIEPATVDVVIADPPYGETSLAWDRWPTDWPDFMLPMLKRTASMWVFGSLRMFMERAAQFSQWRLAQEVIWEKHNGSNSFADRFRRVHEIAAQFYPASVPWGEIYKAPVFTNDATARTVRRKKRPPQWGEIGEHSYASEDGGPRLMRSVLYVRSEHGRAIHPTQKPLGIVAPLLAYSCPPGGLVLDAFAGSGTAAIAARVAGLRYIGFEINPEYVAAAEQRIRSDAPLFAEATA